MESGWKLTQNLVSEYDYLEELLRGTGRTTKLLKNCLPNAMFVVGSNAIAKTIRDMAVKNNRPDVKVISYKSLLSNHEYRGSNISEVVCDHFLRMTVDEWNEIYRIKGFILGRVNNEK